MLPVRLRIVGALAAVAVALTFAPLPAQASPAQLIPGPNVPNYRSVLNKVSAARRADAKALVHIQARAIGRTRRSLNYAKANAYDMGRTTTRRKFAAAWLSMGRKITHISKAELKKVKRYTPKRRSLSAAAALAVSCPGRSGVTRPKASVRLYLNRCQTSTLKAYVGLTAAVAAFVALYFPLPEVTLSMGIIVALGSITAIGIDTLQDFSGSGSIYANASSTSIGVVTYVMPQ